VPPLAGRSPSYVILQLYDMQHGNRAGGNAAMITQVVQKLDENDMIAIAAYVASVQP